MSWPAGGGRSAVMLSYDPPVGPPATLERNGAWSLSSAWNQFPTNSISFNSSTAHTVSLTFLTPRQVIQIDADNGGTGPSTITLACPGQTTVSVVVPLHQLTTITTGWTGSCTSLTIGSSNTWDTNFDNLIIH